VALFRRGTKPPVPDEPAQGADEVDPDAPAYDEPDDAGLPGGAGTAEGAAPVAPAGPWDADDAPQGLPRVDLGALLLPGVDGMELRMEVDQKTSMVTGVTVTLAGSVLQLQAFAAPRTEGIWDDIRDEIAASISEQGGTVDDLPGPFGRELLARMPVRTAEGRTGHRPARFLGADGPRWFLRGVVTGKAAVDPEAAAALEQLFAGVVVVRGTEARPPRDLLPLRMPGQTPAPEAGTAAGPDFDPLRRGPEITEIR